jgi:FkbM family methyltransferase
MSSSMESRRVQDIFIHSVVAIGRYLPKGRTSLFRVAHRIAGSPPRVMGNFDSQGFCVDVADEGIALQAYLWDRWEPDVTRLILGLLRPGSTFIDVGANKGIFSLLAAKRVLPQGRVISYEPHPRNADDIDCTIELNQHVHWTNRRVAVSSSEGQIKLFTPGWEEGMSGWGSIHRPSSSFIVVDKVALSSDLTALGIEHVDVLKIDIEGHEVEALKGAEAMFSEQRVDKVLVEVHLSELQHDGIKQLFDFFDAHRYQPRMLMEDGDSNLKINSLSESLIPVSCEDIASIPPSPRARPHVMWERVGAKK